MNAWFTENWLLIKDLITTVLSAAAVGISIWAILKSYSVDRRQKKYLDIQILEHDRKEEDRKKADPYGEIINIGHDSWQLEISNQGQSKAKNLSVKFPLRPNLYGVFLDEKALSNIPELEPARKSVYRVSQLYSLDPFQVIFKWDDNYGTGRTKKATIYING